MPSALEV